MRKSKPTRALPRGTRPSLQQGQLIMSSGIPSLDFLLGKHSLKPLITGGGVIVGTVLLIGENDW